LLLTSNSGDSIPISSYPICKQHILNKVNCPPESSENFLSALAEHGLGRRDIVPNINFFCDVPVNDNRMAANVFVAGASNPGDYVSLQAQMRVLAMISNCPQLNNPCNSGKPTDIRVIVSQNPWNF